jgi:hypothetical protein
MACGQCAAIDPSMVGNDRREVKNMIHELRLDATLAYVSAAHGCADQLGSRTEASVLFDQADRLERRLRVYDNVAA